MRSPPPVRPCRGSPSSDQMRPSLLASQCSSRCSFFCSSEGTRSRILNQWVDQLGPNHSPVLVDLNSWEVASLKVGLARSGTEYTESLMWSEPETRPSSIMLVVISPRCIAPAFRGGFGSLRQEILRLILPISSELFQPATIDALNLLTDGMSGQLGIGAGSSELGFSSTHDCLFHGRCGCLKRVLG